MTEDHYTSQDISRAVKPVQRWHAADALSTEDEVVELVVGFIRALQPDVVLETGTYLGNTAARIGRALQRNGQGMLYSIECDPAYVAVARTAVAGLPVQIIAGNSLEWDVTLPSRIDFAWFDSAPRIRGDEFMYYRPHMHEATIVGFHDATPGGAVYQTLMGLPLQVLQLPTPRGCAFARVGV